MYKIGFSFSTIALIIVIISNHETKATTSAKTAGWFTTDKECVRSSMDIQRKNFEYIWTIEKFNEYFDIVKRYHAEKILTQQRSLSSGNSGNLNIESTLQLMESGDLKATLTLKLPWSIPKDVEIRVELTICSNLGNLTVAKAPMLRSLGNAASSMLSFTWDKINSDEIYRADSLGEIDLVYNVVQFNYSQGVEKRECVSLGGLTHGEEPHSAFRHG